MHTLCHQDVYLGHRAGRRAEMMTLDEVAREYRVTPRWLRERVNKMSLPVLKAGRTMLFDEHALSQLQESMRCRSPSSNANPPAPLPSPARSPAAASKLQRRAIDLLASAKPSAGHSRRKKPRTLQTDSSMTDGTANVVAFAPSTKRSSVI